MGKIQGVKRWREEIQGERMAFRERRQAGIIGEFGICRTYPPRVYRYGEIGKRLRKSELYKLLPVVEHCTRIGDIPLRSLPLNSFNSRFSC